MNVTRKCLGLILLMTLVFTGGAFAQKNFKVGGGSEIVVKGTSTVHDWKMVAKSFDVSATLKEDAKDLKEFDKVNFQLKVENLKSDSDGLNEKAYDALKTKEIKFRSTAFNNVTAANGKVTGNVAGILTIAGVSKNVSFNFEGNAASANKLNVKASYKADMKDFGVEPPKAMMGMIKSGKDVEILVNLNLVNE